MGTCTERKYKELTHREWWVQEIFKSRRCDSCGAAPVSVVAHVTLPRSKLEQLDLIGLILKKYGDPVAFKRSLAIEPYFVVGQHAACAACQKAMEQMLAHRSSSRGDYGSAAHITFDRPPSDRLVVLAS